MYFFLIFFFLFVYLDSPTEKYKSEHTVTPLKNRETEFLHDLPTPIQSPDQQIIESLPKPEFLDNSTDEEKKSASYLKFEKRKCDYLKIRRPTIEQIHAEKVNSYMINCKTSRNQLFNHNRGCILFFLIKNNSKLVLWGSSILQQPLIGKSWKQPEYMRYP